MNMKKVAQAFRLLADAMEETAERFENVPPAAADPVGVAGMDGQVEFVPPAAPITPPAAPITPPATPNIPAQPTMTQPEFTIAMQSLGREVGPSKLHAALPAVWEKFTGGVARMSAIPADRYAEIVRFTRDEVSRLL